MGRLIAACGSRLSTSDLSRSGVRPHGLTVCNSHVLDVRSFMRCRCAADRRREREPAAKQVSEEPANPDSKQGAAVRVPRLVRRVVYRCHKRGNTVQTSQAPQSAMAAIESLRQMRHPKHEVAKSTKTSTILQSCITSNPVRGLQGREVRKTVQTQQHVISTPDATVNAQNHVLNSLGTWRCWELGEFIRVPPNVRDHRHRTAGGTSAGSVATKHSACQRAGVRWIAWLNEAAARGASL